MKIDKNVRKSITAILFAAMMMTVFAGTSSVSAQPQCSVDVVFVMDTSESMDNEFTVLCNNIDTVVSDLQANGIAVHYQILGITEDRQCTTGKVSDLGGIVNHYEDWGPAISDVSTRYSWQPGYNRLIIPMSDEGPEDGGCSLDPVWCVGDVNDPGDDRDAITQAITDANNNNVMVSPVVCVLPPAAGGGGICPKVQTLATDVAAGTGGMVFLSTQPSSDLVNGIFNLIAASCPPVADPNGPYTANEGDVVNFDGTDSHDIDSFGSPPDITLYEWDLDGDGNFETTSTPTPSKAYGDDLGITITLRVTDNDAPPSIGSDTTTLTVLNVAPIVDAGTDQTVDEGDTVIISGNFTDPGWLDTHTATIDWGDGSSEPGAVTEENNPPDATGTVSGSHEYCQDGVYTVTVTVTDDDGGAGTDMLTVTVHNVLPDVDAGPDQEVTQGDTVYFSGSFEDPGCEPLWTYKWDFGDYVNPVVDTGTCAPTVPITATHIYTYPDIYTATLMVYDDDGSGSDEVEITVTPKYVDIDSDGVKQVYMLSKFGKVYYTRTANDNWRRYGTGAQQPPLSGKEYVGVASDGIKQVYILKEDGEVYYTRTANDNWRQYGTGAPPPTGEYVDITRSDGIKQVYILKDNGDVYYTTGANGNWMQYGTGTPPPPGNYVGIASDGIKQVYILRDNGAVYYTTRANDNWYQYGTGSMGPPAGEYVDIACDGIKQVYILRDNGKVYYTTRANDNWYQYGTGSPTAPVGPSVFGYQGITCDGIKQVYVLNENVEVYYTMRANNGWYRYGTGPQQPPIVEWP